MIHFSATALQSPYIMTSLFSMSFLQCFARSIVIFFTPSSFTFVTPWLLFIRFVLINRNRQVLFFVISQTKIVVSYYCLNIPFNVHVVARLPVLPSLYAPHSHLTVVVCNFGLLPGTPHLIFFLPRHTPRLFTRYFVHKLGMMWKKLRGRDILE